jgi:hypothetical protein
LNDKWRGSYEGVVRANATIRLLNSVVDADPEEISKSDRDGIRGGAYVAKEKARRMYLSAASTYTSRHAVFPIPYLQIESSRVAGEE